MPRGMHSVNVELQLFLSADSIYMKYQINFTNLPHHLKPVENGQSIIFLQTGGRRGDVGSKTDENVNSK